MALMWQFIRENAVWITPVLVALVGGFFRLMSKKGKGGDKNKQEVKNVKDSIVIQNNIRNGEE